ncbi:MAG TPA: AAA family ATPase [Bryobacteraceae bacterium]|nr:AAA family ATPase [Bryobacteraceae bacterium]
MFISSIELSNILSFRHTEPLELGPLNIVIGANGSGKSNLIECLGLLQSLRGSASTFINQRGGTDAWLWKGRSDTGRAQVTCNLGIGSERLQYKIAFEAVEHTLEITHESLQSGKSNYFVRVGPAIRMARKGRNGASGKVEASESVLAVYRDPADTTPITQAAEALSKIRIYRGFDTGTRSNARTGTSSASPKHPLEDDGANLVLALMEMDFNGSLRQVTDSLKRLSERFEDIKFRAEGSVMQLYLKERGLPLIPATRLSDGTLKFLCMMAILLDPDPAPLTCIDEPESGLHPDALTLVADALREASKRTQLIVTTHSDALVDRFSDEPESIVVCERDTDESSHFRRLSRKNLKVWLQEYSLGELWRRGEIGGTQR